MQHKVRPSPLDGDKHSGNGLRVAIALADRSDANPRATSETVPIHLQMVYVVFGGVPLEHRENVDACGVLAQQFVVPLYRQALMLRYRQPSFCNYERLTHVVLGDRSQQIAVRSPASYFGCVLSDRMPVSTVGSHLGERP